MGSRLGILWREIIKEVPLHVRGRGRQESFGRLLDESQKRIPLRLLNIAIEEVDPAFAPMVNADQSGTTVGGTNA